MLHKNFPMTRWYITLQASLRKAIQPHLTSASVKTGSLLPFRSGVMNLNQGLCREYTLRRNRAPTANEVYDTSGRNSLRLAQRSTKSMQLTPRRSNFRSSLVYTKSPWECYHFGCSMPRPREGDEVPESVRAFRPSHFAAENISRLHQFFSFRFNGLILFFRPKPLFVHFL